jgi:Ca2+-binding EF-hand superfamily protein
MGNKQGGGRHGETGEKGETSTVLTDEHVQFILENTSFDRTQITDWHAGFIKDCPTGRMSRDKFHVTYNRLYPDGDVYKFCKLAFKIFDVASSGYITFQEFMMSISIFSAGDINKKLNLAFKLYDLDQNGVIDRKEMIKVVDAIYSLIDSDDEKRKIIKSNVVVDSIIGNLDKDGNCTLDREEFIHGCLSDPVIKDILVPYV